MVLRARLIHQVKASVGHVPLGFTFVSLSWELKVIYPPLVPGDQCGACTQALTHGFFLATTGPEDGGVKASPVPSDPEKPSTPGEGMLSSDLDRIPTEGEAVTRISSPVVSSVGERVLLIGL